MSTPPLRHISIRVPWHDSGWDGRVCEAPSLNSSCLALTRIAEEKNDAAQEAVASRRWDEIPEDLWPPCVAERAGFMAPFAYTRTVKHPYNRGPNSGHAHFLPTPLRYPPYAAAAVPFAWLLREGMEERAEMHGLDVRAEWEPDLGFKTPWVQDHRNQRALLDDFAVQLQPERSLVFFYAKAVPFVEDAEGGRILIGVGRVAHLGPLHEYEYCTSDLEGRPRSLIWERMIQHTIRPGFRDGYLLPYHAAIARATEDPSFDPASVAAFSPADRFLEFSHVSQLVGHDGAIASLLACADALRAATGMLPGPWEEALAWTDARLGELWTARGPCPGLGAALSAFGIELGTLVARTVAEAVGDNADPWPLVDAVFAAPSAHLPAPLAARIGDTLRSKWSRLPEERRALLALISRFDLTPGQAATLYVAEERRRAGIGASDAEILANPYILYEAMRLGPDPVSLGTVDRGVFPDATVRDAHPLPAPSALDSGTDARRVRALTVGVLENTATDGHTILSQDQVVLAIRERTERPACPVDADLMAVAKDQFTGVVSEVEMATGAPALQLARLAEAGAIIRRAVERRAAGARLAVDADWRARLDDHLAEAGIPPADGDETEEAARQEKTAALRELAESRISVLIGPAGTGKTTLLSVLCAHPDMQAGGVLLLAPTGKARVRMEQAARSLGIRGQTIAQFLTPHRYDVTTGRYRLSDQPTAPAPRTVLIDEASMLTEEMLAALIQALPGVHRLVLIGDHRQLPPIGAGRPFVDIVRRLAPADMETRPPRVAPGYAELMVMRRQAGEERDDLRLAAAFSGSPLPPGEDNVFDRIAHSGGGPHVRMVQWNGADELRERLIETLVDELKLTGPDYEDSFEAALGGQAWKGLRFFNRSSSDRPGAGEEAERWQVLSPVRAGPVGVPALNRLIHERFRRGAVERARDHRSPFPKPKGPEAIVYGDKVINLVNTTPGARGYRHRRAFPESEGTYIANGEIGAVVGYFRRRDKPDLRWKLEVEFASQPGVAYDYTAVDFGEEGSPVLELAYALTVHKAQGSEFDTVILVLPRSGRLLSRELLYTALTRQRTRVVLLHEGPAADLRRLTSNDRSETARRLTNLFAPPAPVDVGGRFYEERLIHRTERCEMVRSKSEVIVANHLASAGLEYVYERPLSLGGEMRYPDFTIDDAETGITYFWEHCGMLHVPEYRRRWEEKLLWYRENGVLPIEEGGGPRGTLIITRDEPNGGIDSTRITAVITDVLGKVYGR